KSFIGSAIPDPQALETFQKSKLNWQERMKEPHESIWLFYRALIKLRREMFGPVRTAKEFAASALDPSTFLLRRASKEGLSLLVLIRLKEACVADLSAHPSLKDASTRWDVLLTSEEKAFCPTDSKPPMIHLAGEAPLIEFARPGAVFLKERDHA